jgi:hypothetical protein
MLRRTGDKSPIPFPHTYIRQTHPLDSVLNIRRMPRLSLFPIFSAFLSTSRTRRTCCRTLGSSSGKSRRARGRRTGGRVCIWESFSVFLSGEVKGTVIRARYERVKGYMPVARRHKWAGSEGSLQRWRGTSGEMQTGRVRLGAIIEHAKLSMGSWRSEDDYGLREPAGSWWVRV